MSLLVETIHREMETLNKNNIRLRAIGELDKLPGRTYKALQVGLDKTKNNNHMVLTLALNYSSRWEITETMKIIGKEVAEGKINTEDISEYTISHYLANRFMPDPEILIRKRGDKRLSHFIHRQCANT